MRQQLPLQPAQRDGIGDRVPVDDVAEDDDVDVPGEQRVPVARIRALRLGEAAVDEIAPQARVERCRRPRPRPRAGARRRLVPGVAQRFAEAEGMDQHLHRPAAQARRDLPAQEAGRGAGDEELDPAGVHQAADESLPPRHILDLVQVHGDPVRALEVRKPADVFLQQPAQVGDGEAREPLVLEEQQQLGLGECARGEARGPALRQKRRLAAAPHADDGERLVGNGGEPHVPAGQPPGRGGQRLIELGLQDLTGYCHCESDNILKLVTA